MAEKTYDIAVVGATGAVGVEVCTCLKDRNFPVGKLRLFASERSAGKVMTTPYGDVTVEVFSVESVRECAFAFLAVSGTFATANAPAMAADGGPIVIDNSSAFRMNEAVPLVVPEINIEAVKDSRLIANPNCTTAIGAMALYPLHQAFGLKKVIMSSYQAASGAGAEGMEELQAGCRDMLDGKAVDNKVFAHPLPFNVIPHIDVFLDNGYTKEEMKVTLETRKIFGVPDLAVSCTAVRIPTLRAHSEAITIETEKAVTPDAAREVLRAAPGVRVVDSPEDNVYPMPITATRAHDVEVGRVRQSLIFGDQGLDLFVSGDQLLRGAALNAVLIAEKLLPK
mmetsp:Transcript_18757/g.59461  ORF Transcript_18757/g.59461 Transcript_18757/m.59461 type:complete len:338 (+) Transcript_18757:59-1072(+)